ncbi:SUMO-conjugating enzyme ubc9 [Echinococcus granulosus]|nr:SUMO-conjugating enzyme ubc9 [Echinococcus granulosus]
MIKANENFEGLIRKWGWNIENERLSLSGRIAGHHFLGNSEDVPSTSHPFAISEILKASMEENSTANVVQTREPPIYANIAEKEVPGIQRKRKPLIVYRSEPHDASKRVQEMLERRDASLRYINDGNAIVNPFAVSKREQLKFLRNSFCRAKAEGGYECAMTCPTAQRTFMKDLQQLYRTIEASTDGQAFIVGIDEMSVKVSLRPKSGYNAHAEFMLTIKCHSAYPNIRPDVSFDSPIFHPNVDPSTGSVCVSLLNEWQSCYSLIDLVKALLYLIDHPQVDVGGVSLGTADACVDETVV